ncbi:MAG: sugar phosphate isomerase/epimerase [Chloroflexi bacterium]|nr:sugar phosphate isomerase/epimerase [Chloroflexota bacterium]
MSLHVAFCLWGLPEDPAVATAFAAEAGFQSVDVRPGYSKLPDSERTLPVTCMAVAHLMPDGALLDAIPKSARKAAVDHVRAGILEAQSLDIPDVYLAPPATPDAEALAAYRESALTLADEAKRAGIRLGIEHFPGRGLPTVRETLDFITACGHDNLYMVLDIGHNQIAGESVAGSIQAAGDRLQYVHVNDNDAQSDLHLGLLEGVQDEAWVSDALRAVVESDYDGPVSVEVNMALDDPRTSAVSSLSIIRRLEPTG